MWNWRICRLTSKNRYVFIFLNYIIKLYHLILKYSNYSNVIKKQQYQLLKKYISIHILKIKIKINNDNNLNRQDSVLN